MKITDGVEMLELQARGFAGPTILHPTLVWDDTMAILIDTGFPDQLPQITEAMDRIGIRLNRLDKIIITHQDIDHIGSLPDIIQASEHKIDVLSSEEERPYIEGHTPLIKMDRARLSERLASLPMEQRQQAEALFVNPPKADVDKTVADGEVLPYAGGITVIFTPGHTPGHICLYLDDSKTLVAGDALVVTDGTLQGPNPQATFDLATAMKSVKKLTHYDIKTVICYHGGIYGDDVNKRLAALVSSGD
ncbi:MAG: MBL fold metallo-hydrolase [Halobacteriota archaeon]